MTLVAAIGPFALFALVFQTVVYLVLPQRARILWAPVVTGTVGAGIVIVAAALFGPGVVGLARPDPGLVLVAAGAMIVVTALFSAAMMALPQLRGRIADPRLGRLTRRQAAVQILVRIPVMTALIEEAFFRGVLHAALVAVYPPSVALWIGAALFGVWHVGPGLDQAQAGKAGGLAGLAHTVATVVVTGLAGAGLVWLRMETGSIWVPVAVHAALNMTMATFARAAARGYTAQPPFEETSLTSQVP